MQKVRLRETLANKMRAMLIYVIVLFNDNARSHIAGRHKTYSRIWLRAVQPPAYNSGFASSDYRLFLHLKHQLGGKL